MISPNLKDARPIPIGAKLNIVIDLEKKEKRGKVKENKRKENKRKRKERKGRKENKRKGRKERK